MRQFSVALHEAAHAVVARAVGLPVAWVSIDPGYDKEEKMYYPAACKIEDEDSQPQQAIATAMAAPSFLDVGERMNRYALWEAFNAYAKADDPKAAAEQAARLVSEKLPEILDLARELMEVGTVKAA